MPLVSVILPVYNTSEYLPRAIESLLAQTLKDAEFTFVDDGSTDNSSTVIRSYAEKDARIRYLYQPNQGAGAARNNGLQNATGEALLFLDSDDFFEPEMLEQAYGKLMQDKADIVVFAAFEHDEMTGEDVPLEGCLRLDRCPAERPFAPQRMPRLLFNSFRLEVWNKMFRTAFVRENDLVFQDLPNTNDVAFTMEALASANRITTLNRSLVHYCVNRPRSLQNTRDKAPAACYEAYIEARRRLRLHGVYDLFERSFLYSAISCILAKYASLKTEAGKEEFLTCIRLHAEDDFGFLNHAACYYYNQKRLGMYAALIGKPGYTGSFRHRLLYAVQVVPLKIKGIYYSLRGIK